MSFRKVFIVGLVLVLSFASLMACGSSDTTNSSGQQSSNSTTNTGNTEPKDEGSGQQEPLLINIATATTAGIYYALGNGLAQLWLGMEQMPL